MTSNLAGKNVVVLDLETAKSADECKHCGAMLPEHFADGACEAWSGEKPPDSVNQFAPIGWKSKLDLGLSIGCYFSYRDMRYHWFDHHTLEATVRQFVCLEPLLVSFNGIQFDFALMRTLLRFDGEWLQKQAGYCTEDALGLWKLCDAFKAQCATSYDLLDQIWRQDPDRKFERGLNSLDAIAQANGLGPKLSSGSEAPRLWQQGRYAEVIAYCADDMWKTRRLFEQVLETGSLLRGDGLPITLPQPSLL